MLVTVSITGSSPSSLVLTRTIPPRISRSSYVNSKDPSRSTTVINERCKTARLSRAVARTSGRMLGSTTSRTTFPSTADSPSPCRLRKPLRYRSSRLCRSPSGSVTLILSGPPRVGGLLSCTVFLRIIRIARDPPDVGHGGGRHTPALEDVGALQLPYALETWGLALAYVRVLPLWKIFQEIAVLVHERGPRPLISYLALPFDLFLKRHNPEDQSFRSRWAARHVDIHGYNPVRSHEHGVAVEERSARDRAGAHRDDPLRLRHLLVEACHPLGHLRRNGAGDNHDVRLPRGSGKETGSKAVEVVVGHAGGHHLY